MEIPKPTDADKDYFRLVFDDRPEIEVKAMFGNLAAFVVTNQQMCAGLFGPLVGVRLGEDERAELAAVEGSDVFGPPERPMKEYVSMPTSWRKPTHADKVDAWVDRAITHTTTLPAKKKKKAKKR
jgi:hypothetical protein